MPFRESALKPTLINKQSQGISNSRVEYGIGKNTKIPTTVLPQNVKLPIPIQIPLGIPLYPSEHRISLQFLQILTQTHPTPYDIIIEILDDIIIGLPDKIRGISTPIINRVIRNNGMNDPDVSDVDISEILNCVDGGECLDGKEGVKEEEEGGGEEVAVQSAPGDTTTATTPARMEPGTTTTAGETIKLEVVEERREERGRV